MENGPLENPFLAPNPPTWVLLCEHVCDVRLHSKIKCQRARCRRECDNGKVFCFQTETAKSTSHTSSKGWKKNASKVDRQHFHPTKRGGTEKKVEDLTNDRRNQCHHHRRSHYQQRHQQQLQLGSGWVEVQESTQKKVSFFESFPTESDSLEARTDGEVRGWENLLFRGTVRPTRRRRK